MELENDDIVFEQSLADKRHNQIKNLLNKLLSKQTDNSDIVSAIEKNTQAIGKFTEAIKSLKIDSPNVNVETNQDKVIGCIGDMKDALMGGLSALIPKEPVKEEPKEKNFEHSVIRDRNGFINKIISKEK